MQRTMVLSVIGLAAVFGADPIRLHPENPHYFLFRGRATALVTSGEHYGAVLNADIDYRKYLATLEADGMNYTRIFGGSYVEKPAASFGIKRNNLAPLAGKFVAPWATRDGKFDLEKWNPAYFERLRSFLEEASKRGIVVELTLFTSQYGLAQWELSPFNGTNNVNGVGLEDYKKLHTVDNGAILAFQEKYVRKLVKETAGFDNIFYEIQNEPWSDRTVLAGTVNGYLRPPGRDTYPNSIDLADEASMAWQARVAGWMASEEAGKAKHLIAQNYSNFKAPVRALAPGVSIVNFHYAHPEAAAANYGLNIVVGYDETGFAGREDKIYRREAWNFMLSGGGLFNNLDYSFTAGHEDGLDAEPNGPGGGSAALRGQLKVLSRFLSEAPLAELRPDHTAVEHAAGAYARVLSKPGKYYGVYLDGSGPCELRLNLPQGKYRVEWVDTETGAVAGRGEVVGGRSRIVSPAFGWGMAARITVQR